MYKFCIILVVHRTSLKCIFVHSISNMAMARHPRNISLLAIVKVQWKFLCILMSWIKFTIFVSTASCMHHMTQSWIIYFNEEFCFIYCHYRNQIARIIRKVYKGNEITWKYFLTNILHISKTTANLLLNKPKQWMIQINAANRSLLRKLNHKIQER